MSDRALTAHVAEAARVPGQRRRTRATLRDRVPAAPIRGTWRPRGPRNGLRFVDFLCGAGGSSAGLSNAGWDLQFGANHWRVAIDTHQANFPDVWHECVDVTTINLRKLPKANALWISPICTEASPAGGNGNGAGWREDERSARGQGSLFEDDPVAQEGMEKTRATFWEAIRYAEMWQPEMVYVENVPDVVRKWALFRNWLMCMETLGYDWQIINVNSAHIGDLDRGVPYAPQWRDRLYIVFTRKDIGRRPDVTPRPKSMCFQCREVVEGEQTWCKPAERRWLRYGRYRRDPSSSYGSYWYTCPRGCRDERGERARVEPFVLPAVAALDLNDLGTPIGESTLKANTLRRIAEGQRIYWPAPTVTTVHGNTFARGDYLRTWPATGAPAPTLTTDTTLGVQFPTFMFHANHDDGERRAYLPDGRPLSAVTTKTGTGLVLPPFIAVLRNNVDAVGMGEPIPTVVAGGQHFALVLPYHTEGPAAPPVEPLETVLTKDRFALVAAPGEAITVNAKDGGAVQMRNCRHRMLRYDEAARAQVLPVDDGYVITGTGEERMAQVGNAVSSNAAQWLGLAGSDVLCDA